MANGNTYIPFSIQQLSGARDFARSYLWDIRIPEAPDPFQEWFPASDLDENLFGVDSGLVEFFNFSIQYPKKINLPKITLTMYDREDRVIYKWVRGWIANTMFHMNVAGSFPCVEVLEEVVKEMIVVKLTHDKKIIDLVSYWVYPEAIADRNTSGNELSMYSVPFIVAGMGKV